MNQLPIAALNIVTEGNTGWQTIFLTLSGILILYKMFTGWKVGVFRKLFSILVYPIALLAVWYGSPFMAEAIKDTLAVPETIRLVVSAIVIFIVVYFVAKILINLLTSETEDYDSSAGKLFSGFGGAILGGLIACLWVILFVIMVRTTSNSLEGYYKYQKEDAFLSGIASNIVTFERSMMGGSLGKFIDFLDPVSEQSYRVIFKFGEVSSNKNAIVDLVNHQDIDDTSVLVSLFSGKDINEVEAILDEVLAKNNMK